MTFAEADTRAPWEKAAYRALLFVLCGAFVQGGLTKLQDYPGAVAEMAHFGVPFPSFSAPAAIITELGAPILIVAGVFRGAAALWLAAFTLSATWFANRFGRCRRVMTGSPPPRRCSNILA